MKVSVTTKISISAPKDIVFEYLSNLKFHYLWNPQISKFSSREKLKLGSSYRTTSSVLGVTIESNNEVTRFDKNSTLQLENNTGTVHYVVLFKITSRGKKSEVVCKTTVATENKAFAFALPVMKQLARRELQTDLQALKLACEHRLSQK